MKRVLFITTIPSPYRVDFFNELGKRCELTVLFEKADSDNRDNSWKNYKFLTFTGIVMKGMIVSNNTAFCPEVIKYILKPWNEIVCCDVYTPTGMIAIQIMRMKGIEYCIEGDGAFSKSGKGLREKVKRYFIKDANYYYSTSKEHDKYYLTYGADIDKIRRYPFSSVKNADILYLEEDKNSNNDSLLTQRDFLRRSAKEKLGLIDEIVILAVGQFIYRKGFDVLLRSLFQLKQDYKMIFVGGEPTEEYTLLARQLGKNKISFEGFKRKEELSCYFIAADIFVLPTREDIWGLVINEAMAYALPVITTNRCIAGLEMINDGENGYIIENENTTQLSALINTLMVNDNKRKQMGINAWHTASIYTIETMVEGHHDLYEG